MVNETDLVSLRDVVLEAEYGVSTATALFSRGTKCLSSGDLRGGKVNWETVRCCDLSDAQVEGHALREGDIAVVTSGKTRGECIIFLSGPLTVCSSNILKIRLDRSKVNPRFLYYLLRSAKWQRFVAMTANEAALPTPLEDFQFRLPAMDAQLRISQLLGSLDDKIELNRRAKKLERDIVQTLFSAWFENFEPVKFKIGGKWEEGKSLPGLPAELFDLFPDKMSETKQSAIPKGWKRRKLEDLVTIVEGYPFRKTDWAEFGVPVLVSRDIAPQQGVGVPQKFVSYRVASDLEKFRVGAGDIVMRQHPTEHCSFKVPKLDSYPLINQCLVRLIPKEGLSGFVMAMLHSDRFKKFAETYCVVEESYGDARHDLHTYPVVVPPMPVVQEFDRLTSALSESAAIRDKESLKLAELRDTLIDQIFPSID